MDKESKVIALHDLAGIGRSSLAVIIPAISVMGIQVIAVPTAVLSSHTGGFENIAVEDLTAMLPETLNQYKQVDIKPSAIYSGYLGSYKQAELCADYFDFYSSSIKLVDPVMGDDGEIYAKIDTRMVEEMKKLVKIADIITPNLTEAHFLLNKKHTTYSDLESYKNLARELSQLGAKKVILKGIKIADDGITNIIYIKNEDKFFVANHKYIKASYPGTGDIFASVFLGCKIKGFSDEKALVTAGNFLSYVIEKTNKTVTDTKFGVMLEECLDWFYRNNIFSEAN